MATPLLQEFPELTHLSREDLEEILVDPAYFQAVFHSLNQVKAIYQAQAELGMANETIARNNLALQESLYNLRTQTKEAFDEAKTFEARWKELEREQREVYQRFSPQFLLMRLRHATTAQDDLSETLASSFIASAPTSAPSSQPNPLSNTSGNGAGTPGGRDIDDFVRDFKDLRKVYHKRMMWGDRWAAGDVMWRDD